MRTHPITGVYKLHSGIDIPAPTGTNFLAANDGVVVKAGYNTASGNMVMIDHGGGVSTLYAHGSAIEVTLGQTVKKGDVVIGISGSGNSDNVIDALEYAKQQGAMTIGWVGFDGGKVSQIADITFHVPLNNMQIVEDFHLILNHMMMWVIMQDWGIKAH